MSAIRRGVWGAVCCGAMLVAACSSGSSSSSASKSTGAAASAAAGAHADKSTFCTTVGALRPLLRSTKADEFVGMLKSNESQFKSLEPTAPSDVSTDTAQVIAVVEKVIQTSDLTPFQNPQSLFNKSIANIDTFCGVSPATAVSVATSASS